MSYARQRPHAAPKNGRDGAAYRRAVDEVRGRAKNGEACYFLGRCPHCPGYWDWSLPHNHRYAFTAHHLDRLMHGGLPVPDPARMKPAHRCCNAWDGLVAQNKRRAGVPTEPAIQQEPAIERTSRAW